MPEEINYKDLRKHVFRSYIQKLGEHKLKNVFEDKNVKICVDLVKGRLEEPKLSLEFVGNIGSQIIKTGKFLSKYNTYEMTTVNADTEELPISTYQHLRNVPVSSVLGYTFEINTNNSSVYKELSKDTIINFDQNYKDWINTESEYSDLKTNAGKQMNLRYGFSSSYDADEYAQYNVKEEPIIESRICLTPNDFDLKIIPNEYFNVGINGILFSYSDNDFKIDGNTDTRVPMVYYEFKNTLFSNDAKLVFSVDGLLKVE